MRANPDRQLPLPRARTDGHRMPPVRSRTALKMHEETMNDTWRSPGQKPKSAIQSGRRTTTSTPNITSDRCAQIQKERKSICDGHSRSASIEAETGWDLQRSSGSPIPDRDVQVAQEAEMTTTDGPTGRLLDPSNTQRVTRESRSRTFRTIAFAVLVPCD